MSNMMFKQGLAILIGLALTATGLWAAGGSDSDDSAAAADKPTVTDPTTGEMVTAPEYGGTLTYAWGGRVSDNVDPLLLPGKRAGS